MGCVVWGFVVSAQPNGVVNAKENGCDSRLQMLSNGETMSTSNRIDVHQHIVPPAYRDWVNEKGFSFGGIPIPQWELQKTINMMDEHGIATGIVSVSTPGVHFGNDAEARVKAREVNEFAATVAFDRPDRFGFFATLTLPDVEGAIAEAVYALDELHAAGVILLANTRGHYLGEKAFDPLMEELNRRHAIVFVHPSELPGASLPGVPPLRCRLLAGYHSRGA